MGLLRVAEMEVGRARLEGTRLEEVEELVVVVRVVVVLWGCCCCCLVLVLGWTRLDEVQVPHWTHFLWEAFQTQPLEQEVLGITLPEKAPNRRVDDINITNNLDDILINYGEGCLRSLIAEGQGKGAANLWLIARIGFESI